jgi:hypothetical protein
LWGSAYKKKKKRQLPSLGQQASFFLFFLFFKVGLRERRREGWSKLQRQLRARGYGGKA